MTSLPTPIIGLIVAVFVLVWLVLRTRVHALIAMLAAACIAGLLGGMGIDKTLSVITSGFGTTLGSIGLVIGLGVMMGRLLEVSGAAERIAWSFIKWLGKRREEWALAITGYIVSIPIFVDSAFVILYPVAKALAKSGKRSLLTLGVALAGGLVVTHHTVPPTPGPLGVAGIFNVDIGAMLLTGMALAVPCVIGIVFYAQWLDKRYPDFVPRTLNADEVNAALEQYNKEKEQKELPSLTLSLLPIVVPIVLIFLKAICSTLATVEGWSGLATHPVVQAINFVGSPVIALAISVLLAVYTLVPRMDKHTTAEGLAKRRDYLTGHGRWRRVGRDPARQRRGATAGGAGCQPADLADPDPVYRGDVGTPDSGIGDGGDDHCRLDFRADPGADPRHQYVACRSGRNDGVAVLRLLQR